MKKILFLITGCVLLGSMCFLIYSCVKKQDVVINNSAGLLLTTASDDALQAAKDYYTQQTKPAVSTNSLSINTTAKKGYLLPNWKQAVQQTLSNGSSVIVIQSPVVKLGAKTTAGVVRKFVFSQAGGQVNQARIIEIYSTADYISSHHDNLLESYNDNKIGSDFSGAVITYDLSYNYLGSQVYKNGIVTANSTAKIVSAKQKQQNSTQAVQSTKITLDYDDCVDYYWIVSVNGVPVSYTYLYSVCDDDYGNNNELGGDCPVCNSIVGGKVILDQCAVPGGGGAPSAPPPPPVTLLPSNDPCTQVAVINTNYANGTYLAGQLATVQAYSDANPYNPSVPSSSTEYGFDINVNSIVATGNALLPETPFAGSSGLAWTPNFQWGYNSTLGQNVYTVGFGHDHPGGDAPSPQDVWEIFGMPYTNSNLRNAGSSAIQFYQQNASVAATTPTGNFIVTITDWAGMSDYSNTYYSTPALKTTFVNNYVQFSTDYLTNNPSANAGEASAYGLMKSFPGMINVFESNGHDSNSYHPLTISHTDDAYEPNETVDAIPCP